MNQTGYLHLGESKEENPLLWCHFQDLMEEFQHQQPAGLALVGGSRDVTPFPPGWEGTAASLRPTLSVQPDHEPGYGRLVPPGLQTVLTQMKKIFRQKLQIL
jgi:hypothetical protein